MICVVNGHAAKGAHHNTVRDLQCGLAGLSLLDTPSYVILLVFVAFLFLSGIFEHVCLTALPVAMDWLVPVI